MCLEFRHPIDLTGAAVMPDTPQNSVLSHTT